jgi:excisionase family DNA binding protein
MAIENHLNIVEVARRLRIHPESVKRLIRRGDLPATKVRNVWLIAKDKLELFAATYNPKGHGKGKL